MTEATKFKRLISQLSLTQKEMADTIGVNNNTLRSHLNVFKSNSDPYLKLGAFLFDKINASKEKSTIIISEDYLKQQRDSIYNWDHKR